MCLLLLRGYSGLPPALGESSNDVGIYAETGEAVLSGNLPYRDFFIEYPPGSIPVFLPPALFTQSVAGYLDAFALQMGLFLVVSLALVVLAARRTLGAASWPLAGATFALGAAFLYPVALTRYDAVVTLTLALAAFLCAVGGRWVYLGYAALGFGAAAKLVPALAVPALAAARRRTTLRGFSVAGAVGLALLVPALLFGGGRFVESLAYHSERGVQVESTWAAAMISLGNVEGIAFEFGAFEVRGPGADLFSTLSFPATAVLLLVSCLPLLADGRSGRLVPARFPAYAASFTLAFVLGSKVLSPQYLLWLLPLVPLAAARLPVRLVLSALLVAACYLTTEVFPRNYEALLTLSSPGPELLLLRNACLLALWLLLLALPFLDTREVREARPTGEKT
ncbi:Protein of unknown function (DUF2029) [Rubrobacter radiotolerans]|uniref:Glycosyltransferase 87 family protein n=1 Tax=Rubrobacter radiotolerans TaxID=42256 RepID=A0A023X1R5_RUBRA|nr:glycosyltransferase 87 family protein [Rubrobacter radiotolerans]AHY46283.1 Protein of unknown function (DUF2029) [Rubrobacter radiotolerans]MDX5893691.1 glycosyltransferase 87 family protein [Rubrobacter radiotolerans]SMC04282.1 Protein of unknown function [Rubrobacter radiotolerans DSM 5868]